jgi:hypothetical protein
MQSGDPTDDAGVLVPDNTWYDQTGDLDSEPATADGGDDGADVDLEAINPPAGGAHAMASSPYKRYEVSISNYSGIWGTIRGTAQGLVVGSVRDSWAFDRKSDTLGATYYFGRLYGKYTACGWVQSANLDGVSTSSHGSCGSTSAGSTTRSHPRSGRRSIR